MKLFQNSKPRYTVERNEETETITIGSRKSVFYLAFIGLFTVLWFYFLGIVGFFWGLMVLSLSIPEASHHFSQFQVFLFLFLFGMEAFLIFLGFRVVYAVSTELIGKEIIEINKARFVVSIKIFEWKKSKVFTVQKIQNLQVIKKPGFFDLEPFWKKKKRYEEKISFDYEEKTYRFGFWLKEKEAEEILPIIQKALDEVKG